MVQIILVRVIMTLQLKVLRIERMRQRTWYIPIVWLSFFLACRLIYPSNNPLIRIPNEILCYLLPLLVIWTFARREFWRSVGLRRSNLKSSLLWSFSLYVVFSVVLVGVTSLTLHLTGMTSEQVREEIEHYMRMTTPSWYTGYLLVASFFPIAFSEELVFRGYILSLLRPFGPLSILIPAALHASLHLWYLHLSIAPLLFLQAFILFVWYGLIVYLSGNVFGAVLMHGLIDFISNLSRINEDYAMGVNTACLLLGIVSTMILLMSHFRRKMEAAIKAGFEERLQMNIQRLKRMHKGLKVMLRRIQRRYERGEISKGEYWRLTDIYTQRIREVEQILSRQRSRSGSGQG